MDANDYQIIRQLFDDYLRMYSSRDDRLTTHFSEDFSGITGSGDFLVKDREEWVAITRQDFAQVKDPIHIELKDLTIQSLAETIAVATSAFTIHLPIKDHVLSRKIARLVLIFRLESAGWKISHSSISIPFGMAHDGEVYPLKELEERNLYLEELVVERTIQLSEANENLQRANEELLREIAEHKQAEETLRESEERYRFLFTGAGDGIIILSTDARLVEVNESFARMHGYSCQEMQQLGLEDLHTPESSLLAPERIRRLLTGETLMFEVEHYHRDGHTFPLEVLAGQVSYGGESYLQCFHREITERREHEKELLKIEKLESLGALAGGIAHDFNNILTGIMGNISFAQMFLDAAHKSYKPLAEAEKASLRAGELANQLLTFARGGDPVKKVVSLQHLVNETISLVLRGSNVKGTIEIPDSIHAIEADEGQMIQVFHNIIINATQAMPGGGTLTVVAQNETLYNSNTMTLPGGSYVRLSFTDQGCGISDGDLKRIFDPYFTTKSSGNGLGLASVHSIVNRHGGHIGVSSVTGKGATFTIHFPSIGKAYSNYQTDSVTQSPGEHAGGSILVMDDEEMIRNMTIEMLEYMGYQATVCENGAEAIAQYKAASESGVPFSAVIMDLTIPGGMGGKETAEQILAIDPKACLIVSSGYSNDPIISDYAAYGFNGAITKPYNLKEFEQLLSSTLSAR